MRWLTGLLLAGLISVVMAGRGGNEGEQALAAPDGNDNKSLAIEVLVGESSWPQWRGPDRNNVSRATRLLRSWPKQGPKLLWTFENAGAGYSCPAVVGERLYTMGARGEVEYLFALDLKQGGKELWATAIGPRFLSNGGDGPRGTPTVDGERIYAIGGHGDILCVEAKEGRKVWSRSVRKDLGGSVPMGGYTESPLIDGPRLVCTPGGSKGTFAALDKKTGELLWRSQDVTNPPGSASITYSSIVVAEIGGVRQYINLTASGVAGVSAQDGKLMWTSGEGMGRTAMVQTPIFHDGHIYVSSGFGVGCGLIKLTPDGGQTKAETVYANKVMVSQIGSLLLYEGHIYGFSDSRGWVCQDFKSGKAMWEEKKLGKGTLTCANGQLYCYDSNNGTCVLIDATPAAGWTEYGRFKIPKQTQLPRKMGKIWTQPVVAGRRLYLRDHELLFCFDVAEGGG